jgi:hypothetical protein
MGPSVTTQRPRGKATNTFRVLTACTKSGQVPLHLGSSRIKHYHMLCIMNFASYEEREMRFDKTYRVIWSYHFAIRVIHHPSQH